jgi:hypothetical protein
MQNNQLPTKTPFEIKDNPIAICWTLTSRVPSMSLTAFFLTIIY